MNLGLRASVAPMNRASTIATLVLSSVCWAAGPASAQGTPTTAETEAGSSSAMVTAEPQPVSQAQWWEVDLEEAKLRSKRTKNALIATSAAFGVGVILAGIGASQCQQIPSTSGSSYDDLLCNNAGNVLLPLGGSIAGLSAIGMLTSGIMLGVSNKRKREIQRDIRRSQYGERKLQWDIPSGALVF
jgi:hypothetical protein